MKKIFIILTFLCSLLSCSNRKNEGKVLRFGVMSSMEYLPMAIAQKEGYFEDEGVNVEFIKFYSANDRDAALQSGNLDACIIDYTGAAIQQAKGRVPIKFVSQCDGLFYLFAASESGIKSIKDIRGKDVAVSRNTVIDFCTDMFLKEEGLNENSVNKVEINKIPLRFEMLRQNKIAATVLPDPFASMAKSGGLSPITDSGSLDYHITGTVFTEDFLAENEKMVKKFFEAYDKAVSYLKTHGKEDYSDVLIQELGFRNDLIDFILIPEYHTSKKPLSSDLTAVQSWLRGKELINEDYNIMNGVSDILE